MKALARGGTAAAANTGSIACNYSRFCATVYVITAKNTYITRTATITKSL
jgi:hypothetical protein